MILEGYREKTMLLDAELMKKAGIFGLVSGELIAFIGGGYWVGNKLDLRLHTSPLITIILSILGLIYCVWRILRLSKKWMREDR